MKKGILTTVFILTMIVVYGQQQAHYTQYAFNKLAFNPAYAGGKDVASATILSREQWLGIEGAPSTQAFSFHAPVFKKRVGLGASIIRDKIGFTNDLAINLAYAYRISFEKSNLSFGLQTSARNFTIDWNEAIPVQIVDNIIPTGSPSLFKFDIGFGLYYNTDRFFVGFSVPTLLEGETGLVGSDNTLNFPDAKRHYMLMTGMMFDIGKENKSLQFQPTVLIKYVDNAPIDVDITTFLIFKEKFWVGAAYRYHDSIDGIIQFQMTNALRLGLAYDYTLTDLQDYNKGSLEVMLEYNFVGKSDKFINPRHFYF